MIALAGLLVGHRADEADEDGVRARGGLEELTLIVVPGDIDRADERLQFKVADVTTGTYVYRPDERGYLLAFEEDTADVPPCWVGWVTIIAWATASGSAPAQSAGKSSRSRLTRAAISGAPEAKPIIKGVSNRST